VNSPVLDVAIKHKMITALLFTK